MLGFSGVLNHRIVDMLVVALEAIISGAGTLSSALHMVNCCLHFPVGKYVVGRHETCDVSVFYPDGGVSRCMAASAQAGGMC